MPQPKRIVILGGGFGGAFCARRLERRLRREQAEITLINSHNNFAFTPLLVEAATSALEPRHVIVPLRGFLRSGNFVMADVIQVDLESSWVEVQPGFGGRRRFEFDHLVLALGSITRFPPIPGLSEYAFGLKSIADAIALRDRAIGMLEMANLNPDDAQRASWLTLAVVGAGYTGVEAAGEFNAFLKEAIRYYPNIQESEIRVLLIQRADRILEMLDPEMSHAASDILVKHGVEIIVDDSISEIGEDSFRLQSGSRVPASTVIWSAGVAPAPLLKSLGLPLTTHGYLDCDAALRVAGRENIWGIGDCASIPAPNGRPYPPTAQHALQEGNMAANNIAAVLSGGVPQPLKYHSKGTMAPLGGNQAIANIFGIRLRGWLAWFVWRTTYLTLMPGIGRKFRVAMDWTAELFFRRETSQLGYHRRRAIED